MKKIFTLLLMALVTVCAHAVQVWSGNVTLSNYSRSEEVILPAAPFANAEVGDKLIVHFTEYTADPQSWHQVELWTWVADTQTMGEALTQPGYHISPGDTECTFIITENLLAALKDGVAAMAGTGYVLTSVDYESAAGGDGTLWEGESVFTNWVPSEQVLIPASVTGTPSSAADCQRTESLTIDAALLATLQKSGLTAKTSDGSRILAVRLVEHAANDATGIPLTTLKPQNLKTLTYDLQGRATTAAHGIVIQQGRLTLR